MDTHRHTAYTCTNTLTHTNTHIGTHKHTYIHAHIRKYVHTHIHTQTQALCTQRWIYTSHTFSDGGCEDFIFLSAVSGTSSTLESTVLMLANTLLCIRNDWSSGWNWRHQHFMAICCTADPIGNYISSTHKTTIYT